MNDFKDVIIINKNDKRFSKRLLKIEDCPESLYCVGNIDLLNEPSIAVIGSRNCTDYGIMVCKDFCRDFAQYGIPIVSGLARGIDGVAGREVIENGGKTIAVLGGGINNISPKVNIDLAYKIVESGGLIVSEYAPDTFAYTWQFHMRNRIISGLSEGLLVVEAAEHSGTAITAEYAKAQGRKVFACPGRLDKDTGIGVNNLIISGAQIVLSARDVINNIKIFKNNIIPDDKILKKSVFNVYKKNIDEELEQKENELNEKELLNILDTPKSIEELEQITNCSRMDILVELTILEAQGIIKNIGGVGYQKV